MNRTEQCKETYEMLFGKMVATGESNPDQEFADILQRFVFGEVFYQGDLDVRTRELITVAVLTTNQTLPQLKAHVAAALNVGVKPEEIKEAVYHCAPYIGFPKALNGIGQVNEVFKEKGLLKPQNLGTVTEENRLEEGIKAQKSIFGAGIDQMRENAPQNQKHIQDYLSGMCFGDFYTRGGLDVKTRELLTFCIISALGGCESQVKSHVQGNINVGNDKGILISAISQCLLYIGFPRALNALACVNEIIPEN